ncbi:MAG: hypothetical protein GY711_01080 [bacterium]|nr:hypothetical protein [bacterium]
MLKNNASAMMQHVATCESGSCDDQTVLATSAAGLAALIATYQCCEED